MRTSRWWWCFLLLALSVLVTGCWDAKELEHIIYLNGIGVDYFNDEFVLYGQVIEFGNVGKIESGGARMPSSSWIAKGVGKTFDMAAQNLYPYTQQRISWGHISFIVFTERALKSGVLNGTLELLDRYHEIRRSIWVFGTKQPIMQLLTVQPILNISPLYSQLSNPSEIYSQYSYIRVQQLREFVADLFEPGGIATLPYLSVSTQTWRKDKDPYPEIGISGLGVLVGGDLKGHILATNLRGLRWLESKMHRTPLFLYEHQKPVGVLIVTNSRPHVTASERDGRLNVQIKVRLQAKILEMLVPLTHKQLTTMAKRAIAEQIRGTYENGLNQQTDVFKLTETLYRQDPAAWHRLTQDGKKLPLTADSIESIDVQFNIESSGKQKIRTPSRQIPH